MSFRVWTWLMILMWVIGIAGFLTGIGELRGFAAGGMIVLAIVALSERRKVRA